MKFFVSFLIAALLPFQSSAEVSVVPTSQEQVQLSFSPVVKKAVPAVVNIVAKRASHSQGVSPLFDDPTFKHFFGEKSPFGNSPARMQRSLGSGVIVRSDGIVITNLHVIRKAKEITVVLSDNREFETEVIAKEPRTDLAALKIKGLKGPLPFLKLRNADELEVGDIVLAIGNPFGFGHTVTSGIISALARSQLGVEDFRSFIQTDADINPGNSGGALITLDGKLIGINTVILSKSGGSIGIGFAIPSNLVAPVIDSVNRGGKVIRPWTGVAIQDISPSHAKKLMLERPMGARISSIYPKSPADRAGLKVGDILLAIDGKELRGSSAFRFQIATRKIGATTKLEILRAGVKQELSMILEAPPGDKKRATLLTGRHPFSGALVADITPALVTELGINYMEKGVLILKIKPDTPAHQIGFMPGDVIREVNGHDVDSIRDLARYVTRNRQGWQIEMNRGAKSFKIFLNP